MGNMKTLGIEDISEIFLYTTLLDISKKLEQRNSLKNNELQILESIFESARAYEVGDYKACPIFKPNETYMALLRVMNSKMIPLEKCINEMQNIMNNLKDSRKITGSIVKDFVNELINVLTEDIYESNIKKRLENTGYGQFYRF